MSPEAAVAFEECHRRAQRPSGGLTLIFVSTAIEAVPPGVAPTLFVRQIDEPMLLLVGARDGTTPPSLSQGLYAASPLSQARKTLKVVKGAGHADVMTKADAMESDRAFLGRLE